MTRDLAVRAERARHAVKAEQAAAQARRDQDRRLRRVAARRKTADLVAARRGRIG